MKTGVGNSLSPAFIAVLSTALEVAIRIDPTGLEWRRVRFDSAAASIVLPGGDALDLGWVAKGYALDQALRPLAAAADSAILTMGGQYLIWTQSVGGSTARAGRDVGVVDPDNTLATVAVIEVPPGTWAVSTTSSVERPDLVTEPGRGAKRVRAVTTLAHRARTAMAWSTALYRVGCDRALALAEGLEDVEVLCVDDRALWSPGLEGRIRTVRDSAAGPARARGPGRAPAGGPEENGSTNRAGTPRSSRSGPRTS